MTCFQSGTTTGIVISFNPVRGFGFIASSLGQMFVHRTAVEKVLGEFVPGAEVTVDYRTAEKGLKAVAVHSVKPPVFELGTVKWFDEHKGFGYIELAGGAADVFLHISVADAAGVVPWEGLALEFCAVEAEKGRRAVVIRQAQEAQSTPPKPTSAKREKANGAALH